MFRKHGEVGGIISRSILSKAADKSKRASRKTFSSSKEKRKSITIFRSAVGCCVRIGRHTESDCIGCL